MDRYTDLGKKKAEKNFQIKEQRNEFHKISSMFMGLPEKHNVHYIYLARGSLEISGKRFVARQIGFSINIMMQ